MKLKDSGKRAEFDTGAVRDCAEGKGRCDLLPLGVLGNLFGDIIFTFIDGYVRFGGVKLLRAAIKEFSVVYMDECDFYDTSEKKLAHTILEASKQFEDGMQKYGERNWEKGIPLHRYIDSAVRHYLKFLRGDTDEPHDRAFIWNLLCAIWTHENKPETIDLPFKDRKELHND